MSIQAINLSLNFYVSTSIALNTKRNHECHSDQGSKGTRRVFSKADIIIERQLHLLCQEPTSISCTSYARNVSDCRTSAMLASLYEKVCRMWQWKEKIHNALSYELSTAPRWFRRWERTFLLLIRANNSRRTRRRPINPTSIRRWSTRALRQAATPTEQTIEAVLS